MMRERKKINAKFFEKKKCNDYKFLLAKTKISIIVMITKSNKSLKPNNKTERKQNNEND